MLTNFFQSSSRRGVSWTMIGFGLTYAIRLFSTLALTRLLAPEVFGLMSLAWVFLTALMMISDIGTIPSVIRSPRGDERAFLDTAWSVQAVRGAGMGAAVLLLAWPVSRIYDAPQLFPMLCAMAVIPALHGLTSIAVATCRRHVELGRLTLLESGGQILGTILNILFAWWLESVWALVIGAILGTLFNLVASYVWLPPHRPRLRFDRDVMAEIVTFGRWVLLGTLFTYLGGQGSTAIMGLHVPPEVLGLIVIATTIAWALGDLVGRVLSQVAFPALARVAREGGSLAPTVARLKRTIFFGVLPGFLLVSLLSQHIIDLLYDARYAAAGGFLALFALNGAIGVLSMPYQNAMLAAGDSRRHSVVMGVHAVGTVVMMPVGAQVFGPYGMIYGMGAALLLSFGVSAFFARRHGTSGLGYDAASLFVVGVFYLYQLV